MSVGETMDERYRVRYVWLLATTAALGGLLFGYDWVVIGGAKPFYERFFRLDTEQLVGWANSCALLGCLLGSLMSGEASDRFGRKKLLIASAVLFAPCPEVLRIHLGETIVRRRAPRKSGHAEHQARQDRLLAFPWAPHAPIRVNCEIRELGGCRRPPPPRWLEDLPRSWAAGAALPDRPASSPPGGLGSR